MVLSRKASITISMSWVFMIVVGTFFLLFAYNIVNKYHQVENAKYELELKSALRNILNTAGRTAGIEDNSLEPTGNIFNGKSIDVECVEGFPILSIDNGKIVDVNNEFLKNYPVFMTHVQDGNIGDTFIAEESFKMPFKITNMLAIVSKRNLIVFDNNSKITTKFLYKFNKGSYSGLNYIEKDISNLQGFDADIKKKNLNSVVFVSDYKANFDKSIFDKLNIMTTWVQIKQGPDGKYGTIYFTDKNGFEGSYNYIDLTGSLGLPTMAVFSNPQTFNCSYNLLVNSIVPVYNFYLNKTNFIKKRAALEPVCSSSLISSSKTQGIEQVMQYSDFEDMLRKVSDFVNKDKFNKVDKLYNLLKELNSGMKSLEKFNCIYVY